MLSMLIQARILSYFIGIATVSLPADNTTLTWLSVYNGKRDALVGLTRCFEQLMMKDMPYVDGGMIESLVSLRFDYIQPMALQMAAKNALETWDK